MQITPADKPTVRTYHSGIELSEEQRQQAEEYASYAAWLEEGYRSGTLKVPGYIEAWKNMQAWLAKAAAQRFVTSQERIKKENRLKKESDLNKQAAQSFIQSQERIKAENQARAAKRVIRLLPQEIMDDLDEEINRNISKQNNHPLGDIVGIVPDEKKGEMDFTRFNGHQKCTDEVN